MALIWTDAEASDFRDPYIDFSWELRQRREPPVGNAVFEPIFVRLKTPGRTARQTLLGLVKDERAPLLMEPFEQAVLARRCAATDPDAGLPDEYALYRALGTPDAEHAALFDVLDTGTPVALDPSGIPDTDALPGPAALEAGTPAQPIVAIVDDGIGFLNARFRKGTHSRFHAVWLQALERREAGSRRACLGEVLTREEIDTLLQAGPALNEAAVYADQNARLARHDARRSTDHGTSHGTHMLDLAAGADPDDARDPARDWPLLAVQLPPQAVADTSGTRFESYVVQAMRWILRQAEAIDPRAPVIVNLSLGMLAGPKDGSRFASYQLAREAAEWERVKKQPVRVVWSFGNDYRKRLVAGLDFAIVRDEDDDTQAVDWRIQPGDQTESFLELRAAPGQSLDGLALSLETPAGLASGFVQVAPGETRSLMRGDKAVARIYHVPERRLDSETVQRAHYLLAIGPTDSRHREPLAPAGRWRLHCRYETRARLNLVLQIQRDDSLSGYRARARQSYFDDPGAHDWSAGYLDYSALSSPGAIRHAGSHNALASSTARQVFLVGAARCSREDDDLPPADYTGEGAHWSVEGPTVATVADRSRIRAGVLASGTLSGSSRALNGTSAAAGRLTRALALSATTLKANATSPHVADLASPALALHEVPRDRRSRLGDYVVEPST
ncbi:MULTISPECIES: S8 family serine peptidase [Salipiger]|uniref:Subtilase family protease n=1 Tax=Salipiger profundus TaxID=1229727 RepID=A0A1U7DC73_9RHOB|nr:MULTISPECIES: S8 family serine peptidase [Salipiger]APX25660.1 subtilase family protease [Salipiger profundus]GGA04202.1 hypothetical protein GCM10011326_14660 [Salipiger profundus]